MRNKLGLEYSGFGYATRSFGYSDESPSTEMKAFTFGIHGNAINKDDIIANIDDKLTFGGEAVLSGLSKGSDEAVRQI